MAYDNTKLTLTLHANTDGGGGSLWHYRQATDNIGTMDNDGYFSDAYDFGVRAGDIIFVFDTGNGTFDILGVKVCTATAGSRSAAIRAKSRCRR